MKLSLAGNLINWVCPLLVFPECLQLITAAALCTVAIKCSGASAFNPESQYFISWYTKISWLCWQQPGADKASNEGCNCGPTGHDFTDNVIVNAITGLEPIPETTTWKQLNTIKNPFSCDLNKNATRPCCRAFTTLVPSFYPWLLALQRTFQDSTKDRTTMDSWLKSICQNLKISGQVFRERKIAPQALHHKLFLANAHLPGTFYRQLWWTLWINGQ